MNKILSVFFPAIMFIITFVFIILCLVSGWEISFIMFISILCCFLFVLFPIHCIIRKKVDISKNFITRIIITVFDSVIIAYSWTNSNIAISNYLLYIPLLLSILTTAYYFFYLGKVNT